MILFAAVLAQSAADRDWPWFQSGRKPSALAIEYAIGFTRGETPLPSGCLLRTDVCKLRGAASRSADWSYEVRKADCRKTAIDSFDARCRFEIVESGQGRKARSACEATFSIAGTSEEPARWELALLSGDPRDYHDLTCKLKAKG